MDVDEFGKDSGLLLFSLGMVVAPFLLQGDMVFVCFDEEVGELLFCRFLFSGIASSFFSSFLK